MKTNLPPSNHPHNPHQAAQLPRVAYFISKIIIFALWCLLSFLIIGVFSSGLRLSNFERVYDPGGAAIVLDVAACDVEFRPATTAAPIIRYLARINVAKVVWILDETDPSISEGGTFANTRASCKSVPWIPDHAGCRQLCLIQIDVPESTAASFKIRQSSDDTSLPRLSVLPGVSMLSLSVFGPSMNVDVASAAIGSLYTKLVDGYTRVQNSTISSITVKASGSGSAHILDVPSYGRSAQLQYRQPSDRFCLATDLPASSSNSSTFESAPPLSGPGCDLSDILTGASTANSWAYSKMRTRFDTNNEYMKARYPHAHTLSLLPSPLSSHRLSPLTVTGPLLPVAAV